MLKNVRRPAARQLLAIAVAPPLLVPPAAIIAASPSSPPRAARSPCTAAAIATARERVAFDTLLELALGMQLYQVPHHLLARRAAPSASPPPLAPPLGTVPCSAGVAG
jgi:hypothetical protein